MISSSAPNTTITTIPAPTTTTTSTTTAIQSSPSSFTLRGDQHQHQRSGPQLPPPPPQSGESSEENDDEDVGDDQQKGLSEVDAGSIIAPILSRTQSSVLYAAAAAAAASNPSRDDDGKRPSQTSTATTGAGGPGPDGQAPSSSPLPPRHHRHANQHDQRPPNTKKSLPPPSKNSSSAFTLPLFQLPSLPRNVSLPSLSFGSSSGSETMTEKFRRQRAKTNSMQFSGSSLFSAQRTSTFFGKQTAPPPPPPPSRRRSSSASSMVRLSRAATSGSTTSSLGDDARFGHITQMTNSRLKALKDNLMAGFPTMPQLPHLQQHLASLNPFADPAEHASPATILPRSPALEALDSVTGDVVVLGGYRGSILRDAASGRRLWIPLKVGFNLRKVDLAVGLDPADEERAADRIRPEGMLLSISAVDIGRRLMRRLRTAAAEHDRRVHDWGYDWRLSPALIAKRLIAFLETLPCNRPVCADASGPRKRGRGALVIAHSLGGLIVRNAINQRPELFSGVVFAGTPMTCINILGPLKNGDSVLFNSKVFTAQVRAGAGKLRLLAGESNY